MGRRPTYKTKNVLEAAVALFRDKGFHQVSVEDIVETTGLNRFALYEKFGSKEDLFYATLDFYHQTMVRDGLLGPLYGDRASVATVLKRLSILRRMNLNSAVRPGCLIVNANIELGGKNERVAEAAECVGNTFREAMALALSRSARHGELNDDTSVDDRARYLALMIQAFFSLAYLSRDAADQLIGRLLEEVAGWRAAGVPRDMGKGPPDRLSA